MDRHCATTCQTSYPPMLIQEVMRVIASGLQHCTNSFGIVYSIVICRFSLKVSNCIDPFKMCGYLSPLKFGISVTPQLNMMTESKQ